MARVGHLRGHVVLTADGEVNRLYVRSTSERLGANFRLEMGETIRITAGPLLEHSPHVLYTNIVEALLRFLAVTKGRVLLHSACVRLGDTGVMLSARTDTGKTGTILRMIREQGATFLSDDMTIVEPSGRAHCFPKPLTISHSHPARRRLPAACPGPSGASCASRVGCTRRRAASSGCVWPR